jgi:hypothetical protein
MTVKIRRETSKIPVLSQQHRSKVTNISRPAMPCRLPESSQYSHGPEDSSIELPNWQLFAASNNPGTHPSAYGSASKQKYNSSHPIGE